MGGTFSLSVHHKDFTTFAAQSGLITLPEQPYRYFTISSTLIVVSSSLQHVKELHGTNKDAKSLIDKITDDPPTSASDDTFIKKGPGEPASWGIIICRNKQCV